MNNDPEGIMKAQMVTHGQTGLSDQRKPSERLYGRKQKPGKDHLCAMEVEELVIKTHIYAAVQCQAKHMPGSLYCSQHQPKKRG